LSEQAPETLSEVEGAQQKGFYSLLALAQSLSERSHAHKIDLLVVSNHLFEVTGDEVLDATKAPLLGPVKVISQEFSDIRCRYLDIIESADSEANQRAVNQILLEFSSQDTEPIVAHRNGRRWVQTFLSTPLPPASVENPLLKQNGVYLITGGYGGIGLTLAHSLAKTVQARLILVGKNGLPGRDTWAEWINQYPASNPTRQKIEVVQELEALGASVLLAKGDVANPGQMKEVIDLAHEKFGHIHGIIHAAGVAGGGIIPLKTRDQAERVLSPKVQGTWILYNLLKNDPLDFILLTSSTNAIFGGAGQVDYSAANAFLDAFAAMMKKQNPSLQIQSVNWAAWQEVGMAVNTEVPAQLLKWKEENLRNGIHPDEGIEVFNRVLSTPFPQMIVSPVDIHEGKRPIGVDSSKNNSIRVHSIDSTDSAQEAPENINDTRSDIRSSYAAPTTEIEKKLTAIWENLIGVEPIGINDNFFELGGHSLLATQILSRIRDVFQIELTLKIFFETNTIAELSKRIDAMLWIKKDQSEAILPSEDREEFSL
jgi:NAD(P)-dependent dehydrogenase (short-subunit alcohol dehydrogenase family)/acyl carrier protein